MKNESLEQFLARGGKVKKVKPGKYFGSGHSRYKMRELDTASILQQEKWLANFRKKREFHEKP